MIDDSLKKAAAPGVVDARDVISGIDLYIPHYTPSIDQQAITTQQILSQTPRELQ